AGFVIVTNLTVRLIHHVLQEIARTVGFYMRTTKVIGVVVGANGDVILKQQPYIQITTTPPLQAVLHGHPSLATQ
ncbi:MAG: hypothetical protein QG628_685, partial [Patescibacteria group bacterium]|nr:hypothetical protein [Patescibacteria group bacterium]